MKLLYILTLALFFVGCNKMQDTHEIAVANFNFKTKSGEIFSDQFITAPYMVFGTKNYSENSELYSWKFGDEQNKFDFEPEYYFKSPGNYQIILESSNNFNKDTISKIIIIKERMIKSIIINSINWQSGFDQILDWSRESKANVFVRIYQTPKNQIITREGSDYNAELIFESNKIEISGIDRDYLMRFDKQIFLKHKDDEKIQQVICLYAEKNNINYLLLSDLGSMVRLNYMDHLSETIYSISFRGTKIIINATF